MNVYCGDNMDVVKVTVFDKVLDIDMIKQSFFEIIG